MSNEHNSLSKMNNLAIIPEVFQGCTESITNAMERYCTPERMKIDATERTIEQIIGGLGNIAQQVTKVEALKQQGEITKYQEKTKRAQIDAQLKIALNEIKSKQEKEMEYLKGFFIQQDKLIEAVVKAMEIAERQGSIELLTQASNQLTILTKNTPFE